MKLLGAILAGGQSRRFGSDKACALLDGKPLLDHVADALGSQVDSIVVCGRRWPGRACLPDRPAPDLGPLGGLNAALHHAAGHGFDAVLSAGCDTPRLPDDLSGRFGTGGYLADLPIMGLWPASLAPRLDRFLGEDPIRSMRGWAQVAELAPLPGGAAIANVNRPADLALLRNG
ncbi:molybdenum cofactor guanylyltransferase [Stakelama tenebrarum]|uniref:Molybdenum cofactor guanylyltransferase n=1 Tax=Stakelama tenebrarum TaxID=2711215 RepID=A0A6G6Y5K7_9SPHN|nr:molybdenum cofactor guanylyltransferase [Sphingosinithalassobacter tenebrarum]QIG79873.1 molybdenum cofactor guanylyltransferase [Sphingosinithalassobacter tenebrarum]